MIKKVFYYISILITLSLQLSSCSIFYQGCRIDKNRLLQVEEEINESQNTLSQDEIQTIFGEPSIKNDDNWYYVYRKFSKAAFFTPKLVEQQITKFHFIDGNLVNFETLNHLPQKINIAKFETKSIYSNYTKWKHFIKNIGRKYFSVRPTGHAWIKSGP